MECICEGQLKGVYVRGSARIFALTDSLTGLAGSRGCMSAMLPTRWVFALTDPFALFISAVARVEVNACCGERLVAWRKDPAPWHFWKERVQVSVCPKFKVQSPFGVFWVCVWNGYSYQANVEGPKS